MGREECPGPQLLQPRPDASTLSRQGGGLGEAAPGSPASLPQACVLGQRGEDPSLSWADGEWQPQEAVSLQCLRPRRRASKALDP